MLAWILFLLPYQASTKDKGDGVSFVFNLVAIFYVIELDDIPEEKQPQIIFEPAENDEDSRLLDDNSDNQVADEEKGDVSIVFEAAKESSNQPMVDRSDNLVTDEDKDRVIKEIKSSEKDDKLSMKNSFPLPALDDIPNEKQRDNVFEDAAYFL
mmetsp:Transcript_24494/g.36330  ORF Transcript_24494/g.36330 Transcript_24494/m.36330 type:complete len:154 (-) Transcript_24494:69-530(-)